MKGKVGIYFIAPNTQKVRSRLENPSKEFSGKVREAIGRVITEVVNENMIAVRSKLIEEFSKMGETAKDEKAAAAITGVLNSFWDVQCSLTPLKEEDSEDNEETTDAGEKVEDPAPAADAAPADAAETKEKKTAKANSKSKASTDEFDD